MCKSRGATKAVYDPSRPILPLPAFLSVCRSFWGQELDWEIPSFLPCAATVVFLWTNLTHFPVHRTSHSVSRYCDSRSIGPGIPVLYFIMEVTAVLSQNHSCHHYGTSSVPFPLLVSQVSHHDNLQDFCWSVWQSMGMQRVRQNWAHGHTVWLRRALWELLGQSLSSLSEVQEHLYLRTSYMTIHLFWASDL